ncbi:zona pellucida domain-containing protein miniature isoform X2 [Rhynchophorus ferrugineus]|uniref:zona pellucida domain-containing protein miniature isoform X2 n=1 Tax=Rhynchophorus ferrugineus TaxID=354439 RepID=UPI003FCE1BE9
MRISLCQHRHPFSAFTSGLLLLVIVLVDGGSELWPLDRPDGMPSIQSLEVMCGKDHMDVHLSFSQPFEGIVSSKGQHGDPRCVYVPPATGQTFFSFKIAYSRCGTKPDLHGQFYENTVVVQYDKDLLEVWDEAKRLRCEWFNDYEKTASKPPMVIADLDVIQLDFRGDNVDCWMEIQHGKGPWAPPVSGIVPLGSTLTLVVAINDYRGEFDMRVKSCVASDGGGHVIQLSDEFGCVLRPKMISRFLKARGADDRASVITYAFFHAFKFPDALSVHIKCKVEICRHGCLDHCQLHADKAPGIENGLGQYINPLERKDDKVAFSDINDKSSKPVDQSLHDQEMLYDDIIHESDESVKMSLNANINNQQKIDWNKPSEKDDRQHFIGEDSDNNDGLDIEEIDVSSQDIPKLSQFPHGPRTLKYHADDLSVPTTDSEEQTYKNDAHEVNNTNKSSNASTQSSATLSIKNARKRRSMIISDRKARSADVGVSGTYEVISESDLAFSPDSRPESVAVFQGRIREEVVYGICMPVPGFSLLFVLVAVSAVVSALIAGTLLYRYQLQKEHIATHQHPPTGSIPMNFFSNFMGLKLLRPSVPSQTPQRKNSTCMSDGTLETTLSLGRGLPNNEIIQNTD